MAQFNYGQYHQRLVIIVMPSLNGQFPSLAMVKVFVICYHFLYFLRLRLTTMPRDKNSKFQNISHLYQLPEMEHHWHYWIQIESRGRHFQRQFRLPLPHRGIYISLPQESMPRLIPRQGYLTGDGWQVIKYPYLDMDRIETLHGTKLVQLSSVDGYSWLKLACRHLLLRQRMHYQRLVFS